MMRPQTQTGPTSAVRPLMLLYLSSRWILFWSRWAYICLGKKFHVRSEFWRSVAVMFLARGCLFSASAGSYTLVFVGAISAPEYRIFLFFRHQSLRMPAGSLPISPPSLRATSTRPASKQMECFFYLVCSKRHTYFIAWTHPPANSNWGRVPDWQ